MGEIDTKTTIFRQTERKTDNIKDIDKGIGMSEDLENERRNRISVYVCLVSMNVRKRERKREMEIFPSK